VKWSHDRNVRSFANDTFGSTRTGRAIRFEAVRWSSGWVDMVYSFLVGLWMLVVAGRGGGKAKSSEVEDGSAD
jgi:hypothetical protein